MNKMMKKFLAVLLCLLFLGAAAAQAATVTRDGLQATLTTDKKAYQAGEQIRVTLTISNTGTKEMKPVSVSYSLPQMCVSADAGAEQQTAALAGGQSVTLSSTMTVVQNPGLSVPKTGDDSHMLLWLALAGVSVFALCRMNAVQRKRLFALLLCVSLMSSVLPGGVSIARAEKAVALENDGKTDGDTASAALLRQLRAQTGSGTASAGAGRAALVVSEPVTIMGAETEITATLTYEGEMKSSYFGDLQGRSLSDTMTVNTVLAYQKDHTGANTVLPESAHPYPNGVDYVYYLGGGADAFGITLFFSGACEMESGYDGIIIYDGYGDYVDSFTSREMRGKAVTVNTGGGGVFIRLVTDSSYTYYGFSLDKAIVHKIPTLSGCYNSANGVTLGWNPMYGYDGYVIERTFVRSNGTMGSFSEIARSTGSGLKTFVDTTAQPGKAYAYRMRQTFAYDGSLYLSPYSNTKKMYVLGQPKLTAGTAKTVSGKPAVTLKWNAAAYATKYEIYRSTSKNGTYTKVGTTTGTSFTDMLPSKTEYYYRVRGMAKYGGQEYAGTYSAIQCYGFMGVPTKVNARTTSASRITVSWNAVSGAEGYVLYASTSQNGTYRYVAQTKNASIVTKPLRDTGLSFFKVRSFKTVNGSRIFSDYSAASSCYPLNLPADLAASVDAVGGVKLSWRAVRNAQYYKVYYSDAPSGTYTECGQTTGKSITLSNLPGKLENIYFKVRACRKDGSVTTLGGLSAALYVYRNPVELRNLFIFEENYDPSNATPILTYSADRKLLDAMYAEATPYGVPVTRNYIYRDQSASQVFTRINAVAQAADSNDVTVFLMNCHGNPYDKYGDWAGALCMYDDTWIKFGELATALKKIPGRVVIILLSCGSGSSINQIASADAAAQEEAFISEFIDTIAAHDEQIVIGGEGGEMPANGELMVANKFYVIATTRGGENGYYNNSKGSVLLRWMKDGVLETNKGGDNTITLAEMATYLKNRGNREALNTTDGIKYMHPQVYPSNSSFPLFVER